MDCTLKFSNCTLKFLIVHSNFQIVHSNPKSHPMRKHRILTQTEVLLRVSKSNPIHIKIRDSQQALSLKQDWNIGVLKPKDLVFKGSWTLPGGVGGSFESLGFKRNP